jgi:protein-tyrosine phosphatase
LLAVLVLTLLGVPEEEIVADFALTELATDRLVADWSAANGGRAPRWPGYGRAPAEVIRLVLADLAANHGSVDRYATDRLGVDDELRAALRRQLLDG